MTVSLDLGLNGEGVLPNATAHPNPMFDFLTGFVPRKLKDLFKWAEYLVYNSAHVYGVVRKFGEYPITRFVYESTSPEIRESRKKLFETVLRAKGFLTKVSFDKWVYGNVFVSLYEPFKRFLVCKHCGDKTDIRHLAYDFDLDKLLFKYTCPNKRCGRYAVAEVRDEKLLDAGKLALIRWDPKLIDIQPNPITGEAVYYYTIPRNIITSVKAGDRVLINSMPMEFLRAMQKKKTFKFAEGALYHMRVPGPAGVESHWGFPPVTSAIKLFLFAATLRKANEAIALEHITPFRVLFPQAGSNQGDPVTTINLDQWRGEIEKNYKRFRRDPLHLMFSPTPLGVTAMGGDGRALLTLGEVQEAEKNIVLSLGVPLEFLSGGLGQTRGEITLRMIENQLQTHIEDLNDLLQWVENKTAGFLGQKPIQVRLSDFKMIDDTEKKQLMLQLWSQGKVSDTTVSEMFEIDLDHERDQRKEDLLADTRKQMETQAEQNKLQTSLSQRAQQQALSSQSGGLAYDQQQIIAQAEPIVQELAGLDYGSKKSRLSSLQQEDFIMYSVVIQLLEQNQTNQEAAARAGANGAPPAM